MWGLMHILLSGVNFPLLGLYQRSHPITHHIISARSNMEDAEMYVRLFISQPSAYHFLSSPQQPPVGAFYPPSPTVPASGIDPGLPCLPEVRLRRIQSIRT